MIVIGVMRGLLLFLCIGVGACGLSPANVANTQPAYSKPMVAVRSDAPLTIVLDPQAVHDDMVVSGIKPGEVHHVNLIVTRDLKGALETYFSRVALSTPAWAATATGHQVIVNVKIDSMTYEPTNGAKALGGAMDWSVGMRFADQPDFFYRFTDHTVGRHQITMINETDSLIQGIIEEAMQRLLQDMDSKGIQRLLAAPGATPTPAGPATPTPAGPAIAPASASPGPLAPASAPAATL